MLKKKRILGLLIFVLANTVHALEPSDEVDCCFDAGDGGSINEELLSVVCPDLQLDAIRCRQELEIWEAVLYYEVNDHDQYYCQRLQLSRERCQEYCDSYAIADCNPLIANAQTASLPSILMGAMVFFITILFIGSVHVSKMNLK